ncbi:MAG: hypothetical protein KC486_29275 [Myxococcales bacterium]|nr:hypothetical protein [Myxococcales bacterium]
MDNEARFDEPVVGYREQLRTRVESLRDRIRTDNRALFSAERAARHEMTAELQAEVAHLLEVEYRGERLAAARADAAARDAEVEARRQAVADELRTSRDTRIEVADADHQRRSALLEATADHVDALAHATREELGRAEDARLAGHRSDRAARHHASAARSADLDAHRQTTRSFLEASAAEHAATARRDQQERAAFIAATSAAVAALCDDTESTMRRLAEETAQTCAQTRDSRHHDLNAVFRWVDRFTGRRPRPRLGAT